ncbi:MAG: hypothetical protein RR232_01840 [Clostridia bacterium]
MFEKKCIICILCAIMLAMTPACVTNATDFEFGTGKSAGLFEALSMTEVAGKDTDKKMDAAGLSKLPALLLICELADAGRLNTSTMVKVSDKAAQISGPTAFIEVDESITADLLLKAAVIIMAGDAIVALAEAAMTETEFLAAMNLRLADLGINAIYQDIVGSGIMLSAREIAILGAQLIKSATFERYGTVFYDSITHDDGRLTELASSNKLLKSCVGCKGVATGSSGTAGYCGVFAVKRAETAYICVVMGAENAASRVKIASDAIERAFSSYKAAVLVKKGDVVVHDIPVLDGQIPKINLVAANDAVALLPVGSTFNAKISAVEELQAPVKHTDKTGSVTYVDVDENVLAIVDLVAHTDVEIANVADYMKIVFLTWLHA